MEPRSDSVLDITLLSKGTSKKDIRKRQGPAGMSFSYIPWNKVAQRMNEAFGPANWSREIIEREIFDGGTSAKPTKEVVVVVRVTTPQAISEAYGGSTWFVNSGSFSDAAQSAVSKAFRRCCAPFGIGLDLYDGDDEDGASEEVNDARTAMTSCIKQLGISNKKALELLNNAYGSSAISIPEVVGVLEGKREEDKIWNMIKELQLAVSA